MAGHDDFDDRGYDDDKKRDDFDDRRKRDKEEALQKVQLPATLLMVSGILYIVAALGHMAYIIISMMVAGPEMEMNLRRNQGPGAPDAHTILLIGVIFWSVFYVIGCVLGLLIIVGALKMRNLQSRGLAMTACILGMIPCSGCCLLSLPMGIWSLVTINSPEVKDMFS